jgi:hypothetical protein
LLLFILFYCTSFKIFYLISIMDGEYFIIFYVL